MESLARKKCGPQCCPAYFDPEIRVRQRLAESYSVLRRYLQGRVRTPYDADDVLNDFCLRVLLCAHQIRKPEALGSWMSSVLRTTLIDYYRRTVAHSRIEGAYVAVLEVRDASACSCIVQVLPTLKPEYAELIERIELNREPRARVAESLDISPNNVAVRLFRARRALRKALASFCGFACRNGQSCPSRVAKQQSRLPVAERTCGSGSETEGRDVVRSG